MFNKVFEHGYIIVQSYKAQNIAVRSAINSIFRFVRSRVVPRNYFTICYFQKGIICTI